MFRIAGDFVHPETILCTGLDYKILAVLSESISKIGCLSYGVADVAD